MATLQTSLSDGNDSIAIIIPRKPRPLTLSSQALLEHVADFQRKLAAVGIKWQSAVSISLVNSYEFVVAFLATTCQRAVAAPLNPAYKQDEFEFYISDLSSALILIPKGAVDQDAAAVRAARKYGAAMAECFWDDVKQEVVLDVKESGKLTGVAQEEVEKPGADDIALVLHTSGTTGRPKAVPLTHRNLVRSMKNIQQTYQLASNDRTLLVMPLFHVHGLMAGLLAPLLSGGSVIIPTRFSASEFWRDFTSHGANWYTAVPTIHQILLRIPPPDPKPAIRFIRSCSSPLSPATFFQLEKTFGAPVVEAYAMTEAAHQMTSNPLPPLPRKPGSVGIGQGVEVRILDHNSIELSSPGSEGEIGIRGENVTAGYLNNEDANRSSFTATGFFRTGDQGTIDADGYLTLTGRIKELINKGGEKISPIELDNVLVQHPMVVEAVCFAMDDEMYGQDIGAAVVWKPGSPNDGGNEPGNGGNGADGDDRENELRTWVAQKVARFKIPKKIFFTPSMPKTATGKIQRRMVAQAMMVQTLEDHTK